MLPSDFYFCLFVPAHEKIVKILIFAHIYLERCLKGEKEVNISKSLGEWNREHEGKGRGKQGREKAREER